MKNAPLLLLVVVLLACTIGLCAMDDGSMKSVVGAGDGMAEKSILEDVAYWCWPAKWEQYQQERLDRQYERAVLAASRGE